MQASALRPRDAAAIVLGFSALLGAMLWLSRGPGDIHPRLAAGGVAAVIGLVCVAFGMVRAAFQLPPSERPTTWSWFACAGMGAFLFLWAATPFDWDYLPSDPRSQPGNVLSVAFFTGFFGASFLVVGTVMSVAVLLERWPRGDDIPER